MMVPGTRDVGGAYRRPRLWRLWRNRPYQDTPRKESCHLILLLSLKTFHALRSIFLIVSPSSSLIFSFRDFSYLFFSESNLTSLSINMLLNGRSLEDLIKADIRINSSHSARS